MRLRGGRRESLRPDRAARVEELEQRLLMAAMPVINEFMASNSSGLTDSDGQHSDWIEIYNPGTTSVDLGGWHLTDDAGNLSEWTFPSTPLAAGNYLVVFASGKDRAVSGQQLHTNFNLSASGGFLALVEPDGSTVASQYNPYPSQLTDVSYGPTPGPTTSSELVSSGAAVQVTVPNTATPSNWNTPGFDPGSWTSGTSGVGFQLAGSVSLPSEAEPNGTTATANSAASNFTPYSGNIYQQGINGNAGDDYFKIGLLDAGDVLTMTGSNRYPQTTGFNPTVELYRIINGTPTLVPSSTDLDSGPGTDALLFRFSIPATDTYYAHISRATGTSGNYTIGLWLENAATVPATNGNVASDVESNNPLPANSDASASWRQPGYLSRTGGSISSGDVDVYSYQFTAGDFVSVNIDSLSALDAKVTLLNSSGTVVAADDGSDSKAAPYSSDASIYGYVVPTSGTYYVKVESSNGTAGTYNADVYLSSTTAPPAPTLFTGLIGTDLTSAMRNVNTSSYVRIPFTVADPTVFNHLTLRMKYSDGYVAYLNGTKIVSKNAPASTAWNSAATGSRFASQAVNYEDVDITSFLGALLPGNNVLAIQGLDSSLSDSDFLVLPTLVGSTTTTGPIQYMTTPTPGAANVGGAEGIVSDTHFSVDRGFYDSPFSVAMTTATPGAQIYYTLDNSTPSPTNGTLYSGPITISQTTVLKAIAYLDGWVPSDVDTETYLFLGYGGAGNHPVGTVIGQPANPPGFPTTYINKNGALVPDGGLANGVPDYAMDPRITDNPLYVGTDQDIRSALLSLPSVSLTMSIADMFGQRGLYTNSQEEGQNSNFLDFERQASLEWINPPDATHPNGSTGFSVGTGVTMQGGASRDPSKNPKHSFRPRFDPEYGVSDLVYNVFQDAPYGDSATDTFDQLSFKGLYNNTWQHWDATQRTHAQYTQDEWARETMLAMGELAGHGTFVNLYVDGLYWGVYNVTETPNGRFAQTYLGGGDLSEYDAINGSSVDSGPLTATDGDMTSWNAMMNIVKRPSTDARWVGNALGYADLAQYLNLTAFADYMIVNLFGGNQDWPNHNWYAIDHVDRSTGIPVPGGQYQFMVWDAERTLEDPNANVIGVNNTNSPGQIFQVLRNNPEFLQLFADRVHQFLFNNGALTPTNAAARFWADDQMVDQAVVAESARWGDNRAGANFPYSRDVDFVNERNRLLGAGYDPATGPVAGSYFAVRTGNLLNQFRAAGLYPAAGIEAPEFNLQDGQTFTPGFLLSMTNPGSPGTIYYTLDGSDPRPAGGGAPGANALVYGGPITLSASVHIIARTLVNGVWSASNDVTLSSNVPNPLRITEVMYHPAAAPPNSGYTSDDFEFIEIQNTSASALDISGVNFTSGISFMFPEGSILDAGARLVLVSNPAAFALRYPGVPIAGTYSGNLSNSGEEIALATALGETIEDFTYSDGWYADTDGDGYSLVAVDPNASNDTLSSSTGWRPSTPLNGGPGEADLGLAPNSVRVNEVMAIGTTSDGDWIELKNFTNAPLDISNWFLSDSSSALDKYRIPAGTVIPANGFVTFTAAANFNSATDSGVLTAFTIPDAGGAIYLTQADAAGNIEGYRDSVDFGAAEPGVSFGRYVKSTDASDFTAMSAPTFGAENAYPKVGPVVISELMYDPPVGGDEYVELRNVTGQDVPLYDPDHPADTWKFIDGVTFTFPANSVIAADSFALVVPIDPDLFRSRYSIPASVAIFGPYSGSMDNAGENVELARPAPPVGQTVPYVSIDRVHYDRVAPWPGTPSGTGPALARLFAREYGNDAVNWTATAAGGSPGQANGFDTPPQLAPLAGGTLGIGTLFSQAGSFTDPDSEDLWSATVDYGDGTGPQPLALGADKSFSLNKTFATPGTYRVTVTLSDGDAAAVAMSCVLDVRGPAFTAIAGNNAFSATLNQATGAVDFNDNGTTFSIPADLANSIAIPSGAGNTALSLSGVHAVLQGGPVLNLSSLTLASGAVLDLVENDLIIQGGQLEQVEPYVQSGAIIASKAGDSQSSPFLRTLAVVDNVNTKFGSFDGVILPDFDQVLVKYTYFGDANLDGQVTPTDYAIVDGNIGLGSDWGTGDLNGDGKVNPGDYAQIDGNVGAGNGGNGGPQLMRLSPASPTLMSAPLFSSTPVNTPVEPPEEAVISIAATTSSGKPNVRHDSLFENDPDPLA